MTVTSTIHESTFSGNSSATDFPITFPFLDDTDLIVTLTDALGIDTVLALVTHYSVTGAGDPSGGTVTMVTAPATGETMTVERRLPFTQETDLQNQGPYFAETVEDALDKVTMLTQQLVTQTQLDDAVATAVAGVVAGTFDPVLTDGTTVARTLQVRFGDTLHSRDFTGTAYGDDIADATTRMQAWLDAIPVGGIGVLDPCDVAYRISLALTRTHPCTLYMHGSVIHQVTTNQRGMYLTSGGIHLFGADVRGPQYAIARSTEDGIYFFGADSSHYLEDVVLRDCKVSSWGRAGISLKYVSDFAVDNCKAQNIAVLGITSSSSKKGKIVHNHVDTVGSGVDTYGIAMTRFNSDSLVTEPRSEDIECAHNLVENVPFWEGIDTHGGKKLSIDNNVIKGCKVGIALVNARNLAGVDTFASLDCSVSRNKIDSLVSDGSKSHGIIMAGVDTAGVGTATEYATGGIIGNIIRGHGDQSSNLSGGIVAYDTLGLVVQGNLIIEPGFAGVTLYHDNKGAEVIGNTVIDPWSSVVTIPQAVAVRAGYNTAQIAYNTLEHDTKTATYLNVHGSRIDSDSTSVIDFGPNNFAIAGTAPYHLSSSAIVTVIEKKSVGADRGNNAATLVPSVDASTQRWATAITADRAVALPTTNAYLGAKFRIVRTAAATGAFNLNVGTGPLKALAPGTWCEVEFDGSAWLLTQYGAL